MCLPISPSAELYNSNTFTVDNRNDNQNKMQSKTADFARVPPLCDGSKQCRLTSDWCSHLENGTKNTRSLRFWRIPSIIWKHVVINKTGNTHHIARHRQKRIAPRSQVTCAESFVKFGRVVFEICKRTDKQTSRQTDIQTRWSQYFAVRTPTGEELKIWKQLKITWIVYWCRRVWHLFAQLVDQEKLLFN